MLGNREQMLFEEAFAESFCMTRAVPKRNGRFLVAQNQEYADFSTSSYLGFDSDDDYINYSIETLGKYGLGRRSSPLFAASEYYSVIEREIKRVTSFPDVTLFSSSTLANAVVVSAALPSASLFLIDDCSHRSLFEPLKNIRARIQRFRHMNMSDLIHKLEDMPHGNNV